MRRFVAVAVVMMGSWTMGAAEAKPAAVPSQDPCIFMIYGTDSMMYMDAATGGKKVEKIVVPASCKSFTVDFHHAGTLPLAAMGHNWLLVDPAKFNDVNNAAIAAGVANHYLPPDRNLLLAGSTVLLGGGAGEPKEEKIAVDISKLTKGKSYKYFCSFPGHFAMMSGELVLQ